MITKTSRQQQATLFGAMGATAHRADGDRGAGR
jgi:hypothetical protein